MACAGDYEFGPGSEIRILPNIETDALAPAKQCPLDSDVPVNWKSAQALQPTMTSDPEQPPLFDQIVADSYAGKYILVGITHLDSEGNLIRQTQLHGVVEKASPDGITISLRGSHSSESWRMPPDLRAISEASPGIYTLRETGEQVKDPDLLATWTIRARPPEQ